MMIDEHRVGSKGERLREQKEIKVKIPLDFHVRLHTTKVIEGQSISETVQAALANYFERVSAEAESAGVASAGVESSERSRAAAPELRVV